MSAESNHIRLYTASDFERYYNGQMPPEERHQLEKAALDDPFLADALEGYAFTPTPTEDTGLLQKELQKKWASEKVSSLKPALPKNRVWRAAAMLLFIAGAGWMAFMLFGNDSAKVALQNQPETTIGSRADSAVIESSNPADTVHQQKEQEKANTVTSSIKKNKPSSKIKAAVKTDANTYSFTINDSVTQTNLNRNYEVQNNTTFLNNEVNVVGYGTLRKGPLKRSVPTPVQPTTSVTERNQYFLNKGILDSLREVANAAPKTEQKTEQNAAPPPADVQEVVVVLQPVKDSVNAIVLGRSNRDSTRSRRPRITIEELEPADGIGYFNDYVADFLEKPELEEQRKKIEGEVKLSFDVNSRGEAINIKVEKSLCKECDAKAIQLLKQGPKWKKGKSKKGKISIRFE